MHHEYDDNDLQYQKRDQEVIELIIKIYSYRSVILMILFLTNYIM